MWCISIMNMFAVVCFYKPTVCDVQGVFLSLNFQNQTAWQFLFQENKIKVDVYQHVINFTDNQAISNLIKLHLLIHFMYLKLVITFKNDLVSRTVKRCNKYHFPRDRTRRFSNCYNKPAKNRHSQFYNHTEPTMRKLPLLQTIPI